MLLPSVVAIRSCVLRFALLLTIVGAVLAGAWPAPASGQSAPYGPLVRMPGSNRIPALHANGQRQGRAKRAATSTPQVATPEFSVSPGSYSGPQTVTITDTTPGAKIYYSTNGTYPWVSNQTQYNGPITVSASEIVVAGATASGYQSSDWGVAEYLISSVPSRFTYTVAGSLTLGYSGDGGPGAAARLSNPTAAVADSAGNVYVADAGNNVIRKVDGKTGIITTFAGNGLGADSGDGGPASAAGLWNPQYLALDASGHLFLGEVGDNVVRKIDLATGQITRFAGDPNGTASTGPATSISLGSIIGLATDATGNVYIGTGSSVIEVDINTGNAAEYVGFATTPSLQYMSSFAMDGRGNVYGWGYSQIEKITPTGQLSIVAGEKGQPYPANGGDGGPATSAYLDYNGYIAVDQAGNLFLSDGFDSAIREVTVKDGIINTIAGVFSDGFTVGGDGDPSTSSAIYFPGNLSLDASGNIYVAWPAEHRVLKITAPAAPPTTPAAAPSFSLTPGSYPNTQQLEITSATRDAAIYVSLDGSDPTTVGQAYHGSIQLTGSADIKAVAVAPGTFKSSVSAASYTITDPPHAVISTFAGTGRSGFTAGGGVASKTRIGEPWSVAFAKNGTAYIVDNSNSALWKVDSTGSLSLVAGNGTSGFAGDGGPAASALLSFPQGVAVDASGNVFVADASNNRVRRIDAATGIITTVVGGGPQTGTYGDGGPASQAWVSQPSSLAFDSSGNLYVADAGDGLVRFVDAATGIISTVAGSSSRFPVQDGVPATEQNIAPVAIALDGKNNLYIADDMNGRVRKVDTSTNVITTFAGGGLTWPAESGSIATKSIILPLGVAVAADGSVYFSDATAGVVRKVDSSTGLLSIAAGNTYYGYSGDGGAADMASLSYPQQLTFDASGNLFIPDIGDDVVRKVTFPAPAAAPQISVPAGTYTTAQHITLSDTTAGATIYYTLDGSSPDSGSTVYSGPIVLRESTMLQAAAAAQGHPLSSIASANYTITLSTPTISLSSSVKSAFPSNPVTLTAALAGSNGAPSGSVTFLDGTTTLGTGTIHSGTATYTTSSLAVGTHTITVSYDGDDNYSGATSAAVTVTIEDFTVGAPSGGSTSATVQPGGTATYTLSVTPPSGSKTPSDITFSVSGLPAGATGTFTPASVPAGSGATNVTLSVTVPAESAAVVRPAGAFPATLGLLFLPLLRMRRYRRAGRVFVALVALIGGVAGATLTGCGGSGSQSTPKPQPQTYTLTVTAAAGTLSHTTKLTLTVE